MNNLIGLKDLRFEREKIKTILILVIVLQISNITYAQNKYHLYMSFDKARVSQHSLSNDDVRYRAYFGVGDLNENITEGLIRYGVLNLESNSYSRVGSFQDEETVYYVLEGTASIRVKDDLIPISSNDYFYIPAGLDHQFENNRESKTIIVQMGFEHKNSPIESDYKLQIANSMDVGFNNNGLQLLLGAEDSVRDRLAVGNRVISLFIINLQLDGVNRPHKHQHEEEVYFVLEGKGDMIASDMDGNQQNYPVNKWDAFFFPNNTHVGFINTNDADRAITRILAVRSINLK